MTHPTTLRVSSAQASPEQLATEFFERSVGQWLSERRYYTLKSGDIQEVVSHLTIDFLMPGCDALIELAQLHQMDDATLIRCGARSSWESHYSGPSRKQSTGSTIFGIYGSTLLRDRGFATPKPVTASYTMRDANTMCLRTAYNDSSFEEELRLISTQYRTRQTIISRAGKEIMIGQYLEKRKTEAE